MKRFLLLLCVSASLWCFPARAQFTPDFQTVTTDVAGRLRGPVTFFIASSNYIFQVLGVTNLADVLAGKASLTNAVLVSPTATNITLTGSATVPSGSALVLPSGSVFLASAGATVAADRINLTGHPTNATPTGATTKGYVDFQSTRFAANLSALLSVEVSTYLNRFAIVRNNTGSDGAAGLWIWDPENTAAETAVVKKSALLDSGSAGRWLKL